MVMNMATWHSGSGKRHLHDIVIMALTPWRKGGASPTGFEGMVRARKSDGFEACEVRELALAMLVFVVALVAVELDRELDQERGFDLDVLVERADKPHDPLFLYHPALVLDVGVSVGFRLVEDPCEELRCCYYYYKEAFVGYWILEV